ncbi:hypothetical protein DOY81_014006, partial [Sarcophaga bullata]
PTTYLVGRRRSSVARRDPDEILKSLKAVRGELGRAMSLGTEQPMKRMGSRPTISVSHYQSLDTPYTWTASNRYYYLPQQ